LLYDIWSKYLWDDNIAPENCHVFKNKNLTDVGVTLFDLA